MPDKTSTVIDMCGQAYRLAVPGIYKDIPIEEYHSAPGISSSGISLILKSPRKYWHEYVSDNRSRESSPAQVLGSLVHTICLEPDTFEKRYAVMPKVDRRTKEGKETYASFIARALGRTMVDEEMLAQARAMALSVTSSQMFQKLHNFSGHVEDSVVWKDPHSGALLRSRPDYYNDFCILDVKTTDDASPEGFARSIAKYRLPQTGRSGM